MFERLDLSARSVEFGNYFRVSIRLQWTPYFSREREEHPVLEVSVVALGFGMNLHEIVKAGRSGFIYTALGISFSLIIGLALGKFLCGSVVMPPI